MLSTGDVDCERPLSDKGVKGGGCRWMPRSRGRGSWAYDDGREVERRVTMSNGSYDEEPFWCVLFPF